jgi:hypothetical protein
MTEDELKALQKQVRKAKRIATEKAGELHDLVEYKLPAGYEEIPGIAGACYAACEEWAKLDAQLQVVEAGATESGAAA